MQATNCWKSITIVLLFALAAAAKPPSAEVTQQQIEVIAEFKREFAAEAKGPAKLAVLKRWMKDANVEVRLPALEAAKRLPAPELDEFLSGVLATEDDSGIRSDAAKFLGTHGSEKMLATLVRTAASDKTSDCLRGCIMIRTSARRSATFAVADLVARFPNLSATAAKELQALKTAEPQDGEQLGDARLQALYQVTKDETLLKPFFERLQSADPKTREAGVVAFRFLRMKKAPAKLVATLQDENEGVRLWATLVLGEIRDAKTAPLLLEIAADTQQAAGVRCNAISALGGMKEASVATLLRKLLADEREAIQAQAAIALYRLTGEKVKQFPAGYPAEPPACE